eukprot:gene12205-8399_t
MSEKDAVSGLWCLTRVILFKESKKEEERHTEGENFIQLLVKSSICSLSPLLLDFYVPHGSLMCLVLAGGRVTHSHQSHPNGCRSSDLFLWMSLMDFLIYFLSGKLFISFSALVFCPRYGISICSFQILNRRGRNMLLHMDSVKRVASTASILSFGSGVGFPGLSSRVSSSGLTATS